MNFDFLKKQDNYYELFADACIEAEKVFATSPAMCAVGCRKALELAVKWVYAVDSSISMPYKDNLSSLLHEYSFRQCLDERVWRPLLGVNKLGNLAVHTQKRVVAADALLSLKSLFNFVDWIDYCYGPNYTERVFDESKIPTEGVSLSKQQIAAIKEQGALLSEREDEIWALEQKLASMTEQLAAERAANEASRNFDPEDISEFETRKRYIDWDLGLAGWTIGEDVIEERKVYGMPVDSNDNSGTGYIDYLLLGKDGKPLAILEAKRTSKSAEKGLQQSRLYANCLEKKYGYRPLIFLSNGFETFFVDDKSAPKRQVSGIFSRDDLQRIINRRSSGSCATLTSVQVNTDIAGGGTNRYYQLEAIKRVCSNFDEGQRKALLVMATGTGKTRVSAGLTDVLMRAGRVKNVLFLADRVALVSQAAHAYQEYLPQTSRCNLCRNKNERDARIVFSTYPTILNAIDTVRNDDGVRMYTPAHFDLIIVDEAHRSIFKKYRAIFDYFDALIVGLTATPANEVDRNTYDFFEVERGVPTYVYEYETATEQDHVLVPFLGIKTHTDFLDEGITYDQLSDEDRQIIEEDFEAVGQDVPDYISNTQINEWVFNEKTVDSVLETLMDKGIRVNGGQDLGKTVIFAQNQKHARFIVERFGKLFPKLPGDYIKTVLHSDDYSHTIIDEFELKPMPVITVSVDMMDTGIDVPEIVNLVFFKKVRSKVKFWQMIGRGTRLCEGLEVDDPLDGRHIDKERFFIFDWCRNFEFFDENGKEVEGKVGASLSETVFIRQAMLVKGLQQSAYAGDEYQSWRSNMVSEIHYQVVELNEELVSVRLHRQAVEHFKQKDAYKFISDGDVGVLSSEIAPLVRNDEADVNALRFDAFMYGFICSLVDGVRVTNHARRLVTISATLQQMVSVPQVKEKLPLLCEITSEKFFNEVSALKLEEIRRELRGLIRFIPTGPGRPNVITHLDDPTTSIEYGAVSGLGEDFSDYRSKVEHYLNDYQNSPVIQKLHHNLPMTELEFNELERIFTCELGSVSEYKQAYGDTPFGLLVRKLVKLDHDAAMEAFAVFINSEELTEQQISFVHKVVNYVVENGYMDPADLTKAPFDRPQSFVRMFNTKQQMGLVDIIKKINENAERPAA